MTRVYRQAVRFVRNGEPVEAGVANRPVRDLHGNLLALRDVVDSVQAGQAVVLRNQSVDTSLSPGQPVYYDAATATWMPARATLSMSGADAGVWGFGPESFVGGVLESRMSASGSVVTNGRIVLGPTWPSLAFDSAGYAPGPVYLSRVTPGRLSRGSQLSVRVGVASGPDSDGNYTLIVMPSSREGLTSHTHLRFDLYAEPAGFPNHSPEHSGDAFVGEGYADGPYPDFVHSVDVPSPTSRGWLPASDPTFSGLNIPSGAKFGYNIQRHAALAAVWPPSPVYFANSAEVTVDGAIAGDSLVIVNEHGIWWMRNDYGYAPWSVNFRPFYESSSSFSPNDDLPERVPELVLYFNSVVSETGSAVVTGLTSSDGSIGVSPLDGGVLDLYSALNYAEIALEPAAFSPESGDVNAARGLLAPNNPAADPDSYDDEDVDALNMMSVPCVVFTGAGAKAFYVAELPRTSPTGGFSVVLRIRVATTSSTEETSPPSALFEARCHVVAPASDATERPTDDGGLREFLWSAGNAQTAVPEENYVDIVSDALQLQADAGSRLVVVVRSATAGVCNLLGVRLAVSAA